MGKRKRVMDLYYPRLRKARQKGVIQENLVRDFLKQISPEGMKIKTKSAMSITCTCTRVDKVLENKMGKRKKIKDLYYPRRRKVKRKGVTCIIQETIPCTCSFDSGLEFLPKYEVLQKFGKLEKE